MVPELASAETHSTPLALAQVTVLLLWPNALMIHVLESTMQREARDTALQAVIAVVLANQAVELMDLAMLTVVLVLTWKMQVAPVNARQGIMLVALAIRYVLMSHWFAAASTVAEDFNLTDRHSVQLVITLVARAICNARLTSSVRMMLAMVFMVNVRQMNGLDVTVRSTVVGRKSSSAVPPADSFPCFACIEWTDRSVGFCGSKPG